MNPSLHHRPTDWSVTRAALFVGLLGAFIAFGCALALVMVDMPWLAFGAACYAGVILLITRACQRAARRGLETFPALRGNAANHCQPSTGGGSPGAFAVVAHGVTKANSSVDAAASLADSGGMAESTGPVRSFLRRCRERLSFELRWHREYKPMLRRPLPATPELSEELRRKLLDLQRPLR